VDEVEAWRKEDEANEREQKQRVIQAAPKFDLDHAIAQKNWNEAAATLAVVEKSIPEEGRAELELKRFKILMGQKAYAAAYEWRTTSAMRIQTTLNCKTNLHGQSSLMIRPSRAT
jgi:hypothetical protein